MCVTSFTSACVYMSIDACAVLWKEGYPPFGIPLTGVTGGGCLSYISHHQEAGKGRPRENVGIYNSCFGCFAT